MQLKQFSFQIEPHGSCKYDYLEMRDGGEATSTILKKICGSTLPNTIKSTGNKMFVKFHSDNSGQLMEKKEGFSAFFDTGKGTSLITFAVRVGR